MKLKKLFTSVITVAAAAAAMIFTGVSAEAATVNISSTQFQKSIMYRFTEMPCNYKNTSKAPATYKGKTMDYRAIQNFAETPDGKYVFAIQEAIPAGSSTVAHSILSVCRKPGKTGKTVTTKTFDVEVLNNYGHGNVIDIIQPSKSKEIYYLFVGCTPSKTDAKKYPTEVMFLRYNAAKQSITKRVKITGLKYTCNQKIERAYVAADEASNRICFRTYTFGNGVRHVFYDLKKLTAAINKVSNGGSYNMKNAAGYMQAHVVFSSQPNGGFQSFDIDGNYIYLAGGNVGVGAQILRIPYKAGKNGSASAEKYVKVDKQDKTINIKNPVIKYTETLPSGKTTVKYEKNAIELEGIKLKSSTKSSADMLLMFTINGVSDRDSVTVYNIAG